MFLLYDLLFVLYAFIYLPYLLITRRGYVGFAMRFCFFQAPIRARVESRKNIWVHAVSVGEVMVIDGFIRQLASKYPGYQLVVTVTTKSGYVLAQERFKGRAIVLPSPIDFSWIAKGFVALIKPVVYIAAETEIWPNLYRQLTRHHIPLVVINGRISDRSFGRYKAIRFLLNGILNQVTVWCMSSATDAERIKELGADASKVVVTGNIKFDDLALSVDPSVTQTSVLKDELCWVAGSTHPGEENIVLDVYSKVIQDDPQWRLVIVPRHVERAPAIKELVASRGIKGVTVINTIGQLRSLYSKASLVFVGKSLCVGGGHNVIEPAVYGKAIVVGPRCENFRDIVAAFKDAHALVQVDDALGFEMAIKDLCANRPKREALGAAAQGVIAVNRGATERCLQHLEAYIK